MSSLGGNEAALQQISRKFNQATLHSILQKASRDEAVQLVHFQVEGGSTRGGDSYLSTLSRIKVEGRLNNESLSLALVVKGLPANLGRRKTFRSTEFFSNEVAFYNQVLPQLMAFHDQKKPKHPFHEIPRCLHALADGDNDFVVLEDISPAGFVTADRMEGLDVDHCTAVLQTLGRFHALSLAMKDQAPADFHSLTNHIKELYFSLEFKDWYEGQLRRFCTVAMDAVRKEYPSSIYEEKLQHFTDETLYERMAKFAPPDRAPCSDWAWGYWAPNFMFSPKGTRMIDFQLARYGSPVLDVSFFLFSCTTQDMRTSHWDVLLSTYHDSLSAMLKDLGSCPDHIFSFDEFQKEVSAYMQFGLGFSLESVPFSVMEESETPNLDLIEGDDAIPIEKIWHVHPIKSKAGRLRLANNIRFAVDRGYL